MRVLVFGNEVNLAETREKLGDGVTISSAEDVHLFDGNLDDFSLVLDFTFDEQPEVIEIYKDVEGPLVLLNNIKSTLSELWFVSGGWNARVAGFNGLPGFVNRSVWEVTSLDDEADFRILDELQIDWERVEDRAGMVSARVICMIINEAYFTVQEGTADRKSINMAMKLGTGYPMGPFEWAAHIGVEHVYELITAMYEETRDERYKVCPLLRKEYLLGTETDTAT